MVATPPVRLAVLICRRQASFRLVLTAVTGLLQAHARVAALADEFCSSVTYPAGREPGQPQSIPLCGRNRDRPVRIQFFKRLHAAMRSSCG